MQSHRNGVVSHCKTDVSNCDTGKNRIMIYGPKDDGTYVVEFRTARARCWRSRSLVARRM